jgi:uncharacterized protein (DUF362 family)
MSAASQSRVALIQGEDRYANITEALGHIAGNIDLSDKQRVLIKPNFVVTHTPLAATHVDAVRAVLDFVRARYEGPIAIAEGPAMQPAAEGFRNLGYEPLVHEYNVTLSDLNHDATVPVGVYDWRLRPLRLHLARSVVDSDFRISVGPPKTHDFVQVTLSLKNMIMGALISRFTHDPPSKESNGSKVNSWKKVLLRTVPTWIRRLPPAEWLQFRVMSCLEASDKMKMHQSYPVINLNLALLAPLVVPHLAVIDGFEAMEGNGPCQGTSVSWRLALTSTDALAADVTASGLMGFHVDDIGYLYYCRKLGLGRGDLSQIEIVGNTAFADCRRTFQPHDAIHRQRRWKLPHAESLLSESVGMP